MTPKQAKTFEQICKLKADIVDTGESWLLLEEGCVVIHNQRSGEPSTGSVTLSRKDFEKFIAWYQRDQLEGDDDDDDWECCFPDECLHPSYNHLRSECYTIEMAEAWEADEANTPR